MTTHWKLILQLENEDPNAARRRLTLEFRAYSDADITLIKFDPQKPHQLQIEGTGVLSADMKALGRRPA